VDTALELPVEDRHEVLYEIAHLGYFMMENRFGKYCLIQCCEFRYICVFDAPIEEIKAKFIFCNYQNNQFLG